ncbi:MAG: RDD family protein [Planctomycetota bacterium]
MSQNPYQSPRSRSSVRSSTGSRNRKSAGRLVSQNTRFANYLLEQIFLYLTITLSFATLNTLALTVGVELDVQNLILGSSGSFLFFIISFTYYVFFEAIIQQTPAKLITRTKVVDESGGQPSIGQILGRSACRFIPFEAFSFLFGDRTKVRGWHDKFSKTLVVKV